jgi:hypothetical protein
MAKIGGRSENWSQEERERLRVGYLAHQMIINSKHSTVDTNKKKKLIWEKIAEDTNRIGGRDRTGEQCRKKWADIKSKTKEKLSSNKRSFMATGGGPSHVIPLSQEEEEMAELLPSECVTGLEGAIDTAMEDATSTDDEELQYTTTASASQLTKVTNIMNASVTSKASTILPASVTSKASKILPQIASLEMERLDVEKERLIVEKERLAVEKERLKIENEKLHLMKRKINMRLETFNL